MSLILSVSQKKIENPYRFKLTNINVYSFEEALFHCFHYWKQSIDDFAGEDFIAWVRDELGLAYLAIRIEEIAASPKFSNRFTEFLSLIDYFDNKDLVKLEKELVLWENRLEWEKYKERGDQLIDSHPNKAYALYKRSLQYGKNIKLLNNIGIALMKTGAYDEAVFYLKQAIEEQPDNFTILVNLAEASILNKDIDFAVTLIRKIELFGETSDLYYLEGELAFAEGDYRTALNYYEQAMALGLDEHYIYRIADVYIKLRSYEKAIEYLNTIEHKGIKLLVKLAEVYMYYNNVPAAIKCIQSALEQDKNSTELWTKLAMYYRLDYDLDNAHLAIGKAIDIESDNEKANLELARIKKAQGKIKEYQTVLHNILNKFKNTERDKYLYY